MVTTEREAVEVAVSQLNFQVKAYTSWMYGGSVQDIDEMLAMSALVETIKKTIVTLEASL